MKKYLLPLSILTFMATPALAEITTVPTTFTYDGDTFVMETLKNYDNQSGGALCQQEDHTFNELNLISSSVLKNWDPVWEQFTDKSKVEYEYDDKGQPVKEIHYNNIASDATAEAEWAVYNYLTFTYNDKGLLTLRENTRNSNGVYFVTEHREFEYNEDNAMVKESVSSAWNPEAELALTSITTYSGFNAAGDPTEYVVDSYYNGEVYGSTYGAYTYDENGNLTVAATFKKDEAGESVKQNETVLSYNDDNQVTTEIYYKNDTYTGQWGPYFRWNFTYDETFHYPRQKIYHVYSIDFLSEKIYNTYEYEWKQMTFSGISAIPEASDLRISCDGDILNVDYPGEVRRIAIYDMQGRMMRMLDTNGNACTKISLAGLQTGCCMVAVDGNAGMKTRKIIL